MADKGVIFIAIESGVGLLKDGREFTFLRGRTKVRAGHEALKRWPQFFAEDTALENEWPTPGADHAIKVFEEADRAFRAEQALHEVPPIPLERRLRVTEGFRIGFGRSLAAGELVDREDPAIAKVVAESPQFFEEPGRPLG